jgi:hypothetical protein
MTSPAGFLAYRPLLQPSGHRRKTQPWRRPMGIGCYLPLTAGNFHKTTRRVNNCAATGDVKEISELGGWRSLKDREPFRASENRRFDEIPGNCCGRAVP